MDAGRFLVQAHGDSHQLDAHDRGPASQKRLSEAWDTPTRRGQRGGGAGALIGAEPPAPVHPEQRVVRID